MLCTQRLQWISAYDISVKVLVFPSILSNTPWPAHQHQNKKGRANQSVNTTFMSCPIMDMMSCPPCGLHIENTRIKKDELINQSTQHS
jgi:hypothetical protein